MGKNVKGIESDFSMSSTEELLRELLRQTQQKQQNLKIKATINGLKDVEKLVNYKQDLSSPVELEFESKVFEHQKVAVEKELHQLESIIEEFRQKYENIFKSEKDYTIAFDNVFDVDRVADFVSYTMSVTDDFGKNQIDDIKRIMKALVQYTRFAKSIGKEIPLDYEEFFDALNELQEWVIPKRLTSKPVISDLSLNKSKKEADARINEIQRESIALVQQEIGVQNEEAIVHKANADKVISSEKEKQNAIDETKTHIAELVQEYRNLLSDDDPDSTGKLLDVHQKLSEINDDLAVKASQTEVPIDDIISEFETLKKTENEVAGISKKIENQIDSTMNTTKEDVEKVEKSVKDLKETSESKPSNLLNTIKDEAKETQKELEKVNDSIENIQSNHTDKSSATPSKKTQKNSTVLNHNQSTELTKESSDLSSLKQPLEEIIQLINEKTDAFITEDATVERVINSEGDNLISLSAWIQGIIELLSTDSAKYKLFNSDGIEIISNSIKELYDYINNLKPDNNNFLIQIQEILNKGKELKSLEKVLSSNKKKIESVSGSKTKKNKQKDSKKSYDEELSVKKEILKLEQKIALAEAKGAENANEIRAKNEPMIQALKVDLENINKVRKARNLYDQELRKSVDDEIASIKRKNAAQIEGEKAVNVEKVRNQWESLRKEIEKISNTNAGFYSLYEEVEKFNNGLIVSEQNLDDVKEKINQFKSSFEALNSKKVFKDMENAAGLSIEKLRVRIAKLISQNTLMSKDLKSQLEGLDIQLTNGDVTKKQLKDINEQLIKLETQMYKTGQAGKSMFHMIMERAKGVTAQFLAQYFSLQDWIRYTRQAFDIINDLDYQLVDLKKTTSMNATELKEFYYSSNDVAKQMGVTTSEIIQQASAWSRLGYSSKEAAEEMAALSSQFAMISPGMTTEESQSGLVSIMKAYDVDVSKAKEDIMNNINLLGNKFAESNSDIVEGMKRSAAALHATGTSLKDAFALFTGGQEILQNAEKMGNALRSISMRIRGYSEESEDGFEELDDELKNITGDLIDLTKTASRPQGISIFKDGSQTEFKSLVEYLGEVSDIWDELSDKQQNDFLQKAFNKTQAQAGAAILSNFDQVRNALEQMENSAGSADREMSIVEESLTYKLNRLKETWTGIIQDAGDTESVGSIIDALTAISDLIGGIVEVGNGLPGVIGFISGLAISLKKVKFLGEGGVIDGIKKSINPNKYKVDLIDIPDLSTATSRMQNLITASKGYNGSLAELAATQKNVDSQFIDYIGTLDKTRLEQMSLSDLTDGYINSCRKLRQTQEQTNLQLEQGALKAKAFAAAIGLAKSVLTIGISMAASWVISLGLEAWDDYTHRVENATKALKEYQDAAKENKNKLEEHKKLVKEASESYEKLAKGVNTANNANIDLNDEDYQKFVDLNNRLAEAFPELKIGIDENANSILSIGNNAKTSTEYLQGLVDKEQELANIEIADNLGDTLDAFKTIYDADQEDITSLETQNKAAKRNLSNVDFNWTRLANGLTIEDADADYEKRLRATIEGAISASDGIVREELETAYEKFASSTYTYDDVVTGFNHVVSSFYFDALTLSPEAQDELNRQMQLQNENVIREYTDGIQVTEEKIKDKKSDLQVKFSDLTDTFVSVATTKGTYKKLTDAGKQLADTIIKSWDSSIMDEDFDNAAFEDKLYNEVLTPITNLNLDDPSNAQYQIMLQNLLNPEVSSDRKLKIYNDLVGWLKDIDVDIDISPLISEELDINNNFNRIIDWLRYSKDYEKLKTATKDYTIEQKKLFVEIYDGSTNCLDILRKMERTEAQLAATSKEVQIPSIKDSLSSIQETSSTLETLTKILGDFQDGGDFDFSAVLGNDDFDSKFGDFTEEYEHFYNVLNDTSSTYEQQKSAIDGLATAYFQTSDALKNVTEDTRALSAAMLEQKGVANAEEVVEAELYAKKVESIAATEQEAIMKANLIDIESEAREAKEAAIATAQNEILSLNGEVEALGYSSDATKAYVLQKQLANINLLDTSSDISQLNNIVGVLGVAVNAWVAYYQARQGIETAVNKSGSDYLKEYKAKHKALVVTKGQEEKLGEALREQAIKNATNEARTAGILFLKDVNKYVEENAVKVDMKPTGGGAGAKSGGGGGGGGSTKEAAEEEADIWLEAFERELGYLDDLHDKGKISERDYLNALRTMYEYYFKDREQYIEKFAEYERKYLEGMKSLYEAALSGVNDLLQKRIDAINKSKDAAISALEEERDAEEKKYQSQIDDLDDEIEKYEDLIKGIEDQKEALQDQLDAMKDANDERERALNLQKAELALEKAKNQRSSLVYREGQGMTYQADDSAIRDAEEDLLDVQYEIQTAELEKQIDLLDEQIDQYNEIIDKLKEEQEEINASMESSKSHYEEIIAEQEKYYEDQVQKIEDIKEKYEEIANIEELANSAAAIRAVFGDNVEEVLNGNEEIFNQIRTEYSGILADMNAGNQDFLASLQSAVSDNPINSYLQQTQGYFDTLNGLSLEAPKGEFVQMAGAVAQTTEAVLDLIQQLGGSSESSVYGSFLSAVESATQPVTQSFATQSDAVNGMTDSVDNLSSSIAGEGGKSKGADSDKKKSSGSLMQSVETQTESALNNFGSQVQQLTDEYNPKVNEAIDLMNELNEVADKDIEKTITIKIHTERSGSASANGTAHELGTAYKSGKWGLSSDELALTGELGQELVVRDDKFFTVGDNGAEMAHLKKGDIVFNHKQTEEILKNGHTSSRGHALAGGTASSIVPLSLANPESERLFQKISENLIQSLENITNPLSQLARSMTKQVQESAKYTNAEQNVQITQENHFHITGVTGTDVANQINSTLQRTFQGTYNRAYQFSMR